MTPIALADVPVDAAAQEYLGAATGIDGCIVTATGRVIAFGSACQYPDAENASRIGQIAVQVWHRNPEAPRVHASRVQKAISLIAEGHTPHAAAVAVGVASSAVYRAMQRRETRPVCPHCHQLMPKAPTA